MSQFTVAFAGNPNTGKSTLFNLLTGMRQHTGNWAGKTVITAEGEFKHNNHSYLAVDSWERTPYTQIPRMKKRLEIILFLNSQT